jgi:hypothetical protein
MDIIKRETSTTNETRHKQWKYPLICPFGERGIFRLFSRKGRTNELITSGIVSWSNHELTITNCYWKPLVLNALN